MLKNQVSDWVAQHPLKPIHIDCTIAVMLKILDGKCKMESKEKVIMTYLYHAIKQHKGEKLKPQLHRLIAQALASNLDETIKMNIYEQRLLAETTLSRPVMKAFKAMIRQQGLLNFTEI